MGNKVLFAFLAFVSVGGVEGGNTGVVVLEKVNKIGGYLGGFGLSGEMVGGGRGGKIAGVGRRGSVLWTKEVIETSRTSSMPLMIASTLEESEWASSR